MSGENYNLTLAGRNAHFTFTRPAGDSFFLSALLSFSLKTRMLALSMTTILFYAKVWCCLNVLFLLYTLAARSLTEPPGFIHSALARISHPVLSLRLPSRTRGVFLTIDFVRSCVQPTRQSGLWG